MNKTYQSHAGVTCCVMCYRPMLQPTADGAMRLYAAAVRVIKAHDIYQGPNETLFALRELSAVVKEVEQADISATQFAAASTDPRRA